MSIGANRRTTLLGGGLAVVVALAIGAAMLTSGDEVAPPDSVGSTSTTAPDSTAVLALARPNEPLTVSLSAGTAQTLQTPEPIEVVAGEPLDDNTVAAIIDRLPEWVLPDDDGLEFNRPAATLRPPLVGETVEVPFPAETDEPPPDVPDGPLEVQRFQPEGAVEIAPFLSVTFNQPMVPLATVEQLDAADVPVTITPELPGRWQWIGTRTLRFEHDPGLFDRLPMATEYRIEIPAGTVSETGGELAKTVTWEFSTPPVRVESFEPQHESLPLAPVFLLTFNQHIDPDAVLDVITLSADGETQPIRLATDAEIAADEEIGPRVDSLLAGRWLAFRAVDAFTPDTRLTIQVGPGTPSAEGPRVATDSTSFTARTYAALRVTDSSCEANDRCEPGWEVWIDFNNPLDADAFDPSWVTIEPELPGMTVQAEYSSVRIRGASVGGTTYTATVSAELKDVFGQTLGEDATVDFVIGDARPRLDQFEDRLITLDPLTPEPSLAVTTVNHEELRVRVFDVDTDDWASYVRYWEQRWNDQEPPPLPDWAEALDTTVDTGAEPNVLTETTIDLSSALEGDTGHVIVLVEPTGELADLSQNTEEYWSNRPTLVWAQATQIGADIFNDGDESLIWATDLSTGEPLPGVEVEFVGTATTVTTNSDGLALTETPSGSSFERPVVVRLDGDTALIDSGWQEWSRHDETLWYVFDDRQTYRPGETAHIKGWVRRLTVSDDAQLGAVADGATVLYRAYDWYGNEIGDGTADVSMLGGFDFTFDIPAGANLGQAWVQLSLDGSGLSGDYSHTLQVQEFRRPEFEVSTRPESAGPYVVDEPATVAVDADYYAGGPLPDAAVEWTVTTRQATYSPPNWDDFTFGVWVPWWYDTFGFEDGAFVESDVFFGEPWPGADEPTVETFSGRTDANGNHYLQMDFDGDGEGLPTTVSAQATVFDVNRQAWADNTDLLVHPAELYVGLRSDRTYVESGEPIVIEAIVTDIDGAPVADRAVAMEAGRLEWRLVDGRWDEIPVEIEPCTVTSTDQPVECDFSTDIGGTYQIVATVTDDAGRASRTELTRWVSGGDSRPERNVAQEEVTLIPDKQEYSPGDQAEILVTAPFSPAYGLLTLSRGGFVSTETFTVEDGSTVLMIPIDDTYIPSVHIQVDLVGATGRTDDSGDPLPDAPDRPAFATGSIDLQIPPYSRTLTVSAEPAQPTIEPGTTTSVEVTVTDTAGAPVAGAELAVVVVDEAVLALSDFELPDPLDIFYRPISSEVWSRYIRSTIELTNPDLLTAGSGSASTETETMTETTAAASAEEGRFTDAAADLDSGGDGERLALFGDEASPAAGDVLEVRTNFDALALFEPEATTGTDGTAVIEVPLPDSLTRYRVMVVAAAGVDEFGSTESNITARLPLMARPSAPRFLNFGDQFELPIVVQNQTDEDLEVDVVIQTANLGLTAGAGRRVTVPANDRIEVRFPATAEDVGTARFRVAAVSADFTDATTVSLPVYTPATTEAFATYGVLDDGVIAQTVLAPEGVFPQFGGLEVNTSSTALQALTDAVIYLNDYQYESADALASRILAIAALRDVLEAFEADGLPSAAELDARVGADIDALLGLQSDLGGFAIWRRTNETVPYHSIQATHALVEAKANGYAVPAERLAQALSYLANIEDFYPSDYSRQLRDTLSAYALHVRNLAGDRDTAKAADLYRRAGDELDLDAVAWLWPVLDDPGADAEIERLFNNQVTETAGAATFSTDYGEDAYRVLYSDHRTDAVILDALIAEAPDSDLIPKIVAGLLGGQTRGRWNNVQENSFVLLALNNYFDTFEAVTPDFVARIWLGDLYAAEHEFAGRTTDSDASLVPMAELIDQAAAGETSLVVSMDGEGRLYYRLGLRYAPEDLDLDPLDRGFVVQRSYEAIDDPDDVTQDANGTWHIRAGAEVRVRLTMVADARRTHVALVDPLPAGLESLNPALAVTGPIPDDEESPGDTFWWWWQWYEHENLRDDRAEAFASLLGAGTYDYTYVARATTPGTFVVPPTRVEEIYAPETFGRSASDIVVVESD